MNNYALKVNKIPVGVLGASGYAGRELCALIARHPALELRFATANERRGQTVRTGGVDIRLVATDDAPLGDAALVFSALPHGASAQWIARARTEGCRVVDLSADLRPGTARPEALAREADIPYGLTELARQRVSGAEIVANPGCYPTAILLALAPLLECGYVAAGATVSISAASGVTGAGFSARHDLLFGEVTEDFRAYGVGNEHRHLPEMREAVGALGGDCDLLFTPHLLPVARGILATITVPLTAPLATPAGIPHPLWQERYRGEAFIEITDTPPALRDVVRRNVVRIAAHSVAGTRQPMLLVLAAIDNLLKGAAGQAVQNANLMLGVDEQAGLPA